MDSSSNHITHSQDTQSPTGSMAVMVAPSRDPYAISDPIHQHQIQHFPQAYQAHTTTSYGYQQPDMSTDHGSQGSASPSEYNVIEGTASEDQANMTNRKDTVKAGGRGVPSQSIHEAPQSKNRRRTSPHQLEVLNAHFLESTKPDIIVRQRLSAELGMTVREVQVWFQNRRAKQKKIDAKEVGLGPGGGGHSNQQSFNNQLPYQLPAVAPSLSYYGQQRQALSEGQPNHRYSSSGTYTQSREGPYPQELINALQHRVVPRPDPSGLQSVQQYNSSQLYPTSTGTRPASGSSSIPSLSPEDLSTVSSSYHSDHHFRPPPLPTRTSAHSSRTSSSESIQHHYSQSRPELNTITTSQPPYITSSEDDALAPYTPITPASPIPVFPHSLSVDTPQLRSSPGYTKDSSLSTDAAEMARRLSFPGGINTSFQSLPPYISSAPLLPTSSGMQQQQEEARAGLSIRPSSSGPLPYGAQAPSLAAMQDQGGYSRRHSVDVSQMGQHSLASRRNNSLIKLQNMHRSAHLYPLHEHVQPALAEGQTPPLEVASAWNSLDPVANAPYSMPPSFPHQSSQQIQTISGAAFAYTPDSAVEWLPPSTSGMASSSRRESISLLDTIPESSPRGGITLGLPMTDDSVFAYPPSWTQSQISDDPTASLEQGSVEESISPVITSPGSNHSRRNSIAAVRKMRSASTFYQPYPTVHTRDASYE